MSRAIRTPAAAHVNAELYASCDCCVVGSLPICELTTAPSTATATALAICPDSARTAAPCDVSRSGRSLKPATISGAIAAAEPNPCTDIKMTIKKMGVVKVSCEKPTMATNIAAHPTMIGRRGPTRSTSRPPKVMPTMPTRAGMKNIMPTRNALSPRRPSSCSGMNTRRAKLAPVTNTNAVIAREKVRSENMRSRSAGESCATRDRRTGRAWRRRRGCRRASTWTSIPRTNPPRCRAPRS